jgi:signal transduction histidine kinase/CheY-like chemotaxis protein
MNAQEPGVFDRARSRVLRAVTGFVAAARQLGPSPELDGRLAQLFFARTPWWLAFMLASTLAVIVVSHYQGTQQARELFGLQGVKLTAGAWSAGIVLLAGLGLLLQARCRTTPAKPAPGLQRLAKPLWLCLVVALSAWWTLGFYALEDQPPPDTFKVAQRTFIWMTCICNVLSIIVLAPSWKAVLGVLVGFYVPANYAFLSTRTPTSGLLLSIFGFSILVGLLAHLEQRGSLTKQLSLDAERRRSDELLRQLNQLVASISHDLRQPLTTISLRLDSLRDHLGARQYPVNKRELPLHHLLQETARGFEAQAESTGVSIRVFAPALIVFSDREALGRIVANLLSNALKYTPRGGRVLVGCQVRGDMARISVIDTGVGIDTEDHRIIFNEYVQLGNVERDRKKGLGLGLSIVDRLARLLGHPVEVASVPGRGSRFSLLVPYKGRVPREYQQIEIGVAEPEPASPDLAGMVAVVVDDDRELGDAMASRLVGWGCHVVNGASFEEVRPRLKEMLGERAPDVLFCDYRLPDSITGVDVVAQFRRVYPGLPATIWSGNTDAQTLREVARHGLAFLSKPVPARVLAETLLACRPARSRASEAA